MSDFLPDWLAHCVPHVGFQALFKFVRSPDIQRHAHGLTWARQPATPPEPFITESQVVLLLLLARPHANPPPGTPAPPPPASCPSAAHPPASVQIPPSTKPGFLPLARRTPPAHGRSSWYLSCDTSEPPLRGVAANVLLTMHCHALSSNFSPVQVCLQLASGIP
ncbi:hypothetical protein HJG60_010136 [Phyllostomus discolor]|uniref:Uncharacterized protein n=1 Tax=Phyllostomus discolor TaxID=89673 RepID=A0A834B156_9CHIR|nr:hypothetical protein HJG60_010136 [Phyllostomus discolor]